MRVVYVFMSTHWLLVSPLEINNVYLIANIERMVEQLPRHPTVVSCFQWESMRSAALVCARGDDIWACLSNQAGNDSTKLGLRVETSLILTTFCYLRGSLQWG